MQDRSAEGGGAADAGAGGKAADGGSGESALSRVRRGDGRVGPQRRKPRRDGWTAKRKARFLEVLKAGCNVREAVRAAGMSDVSAYDLRKRDPGFAAEWSGALEQGYAELEMALLRQAIHGSETTETVDDGKGLGGRRTKTVHSYPHGMALRLLLAHRAQVTAYRDAQGIDRHGSAAVRAEIQERIAATRARLAGGVAEGGAAGAGENAGVGAGAGDGDDTEAGGRGAEAGEDA